MLALHTLRPHARSRRKRVGRGHGSGLGTFAGRGTKGQRARTGGRRHTLRRSLKSLYERLPKARGRSTHAVEKVTPVSLAELERVFDPGARVTRAALQAQRLIPRGQALVVVLGDGQLTKRLTVEAHRFSGSARRAITQAGGQAVALPSPVRPPRRRPRLQRG